VRRHLSYQPGKTNLLEQSEVAGATLVDKAAFREGNVVPDIPDFCRELVAAIAEG
jgi:protease I